VIPFEEDRLAAGDNLKHILDAARAALDGEFARAERFDAKARGQATLAGSWFAVTQAVAAVAITAHTHGYWIIVLLCGLTLQAGALYLLLRASAKVWRLRDREEVGRTSLEAMLADVDATPIEFASKAVKFYGDILDAAREANRQRADDFDAQEGCAKWLSASFWWRPVLVIGLLEMAVALISRIA
jgi:hypothetical protein